MSDGKKVKESVKTPEKEERRCGVLLHPTSFPSPFGIGDLGLEARSVLTRLAQAGVTLWQVLPLGPTGYGDSPYSSRSAFAGNEYLIDLRSIEGVDDIEFPSDRGSHSEPADYGRVYSEKLVCLKKAAEKFLDNHSEDGCFAEFCKKNAFWLDDYALFQVLVTEFGDSRWFLWKKDIRDRKPETVKKYLLKYGRQVAVYKALQYFFFTQWNELHLFANSIGIKIVGDIPIFVAADSVDAWTHRKLLKIGKNGRQTAQAGVPPDAFSTTGQLWGNPVYNWKEHEKDNFKWWRQRLDAALSLTDYVRIDHFRGFESYWEVPSKYETAENGKWKKGPGMKLVKYFPQDRVFAEDLGVITPQVCKLLSDSGLAGIKVMQFAFEFGADGFRAANPYLPHNYNENCVAYTGTHDNETSRGWFNGLSEQYRDVIRRYLQCPDSDVVWQMMRVLLASRAKFVIIPLQDILGLGNEARMNAPSTVGTFNWSWRFNPEDLKDWMIGRLHDMNVLYSRI
ncbi:MAG: 4-alpha-glucanotransferase [Sphaerochaetaceae bacterium]|nr:4-alpha-glucanotransferase [Sphaerochaetaceae bacterium]